MNAEIILEVENWHKEQGLSFDRAKFVTLCEEYWESVYVLKDFSQEGEIEALLDYYDHDLKHEDLEGFLRGLQYLRAYPSEDAIVEDFIESCGIDTHAARFLGRYLDEEKIVREFLWEGFRIGTMFCAKY